MISALAVLAMPFALMQQPAATPRTDDAVRVYLDCQANGCDTDYLRTQITFINYVRFREDAQVYVLVTGQQNGSGGSTATLFFIGQGASAGRADTLQYASGATATQDEIRSGLARTLKLGLMRYVAGSPAATRITITYAAPDSAAGTAQRPHDPWKAWVFRISGNAFLNGESKSSSRFTYSFLSATRTTEAWKLAFSLNYDDSRDRFQYPVEYDTITGAPIRDTTVISTSHSSSADALVARSLGKHWALGGTASWSVSTYSNLKSQVRGGPILEFDVFPYAEFTRRRVIFSYSVNLARREYAESTIYFKTRETLLNHAFDAAVRFQQPWGSAGASANWSQYLHDLSKNRLRFSANINVRIVRGLEVRLNGSYSRIRDQLSLSAGGEDPTQVLLRRTQLATNYSYYTSVGLSYTFGSTFNNVVNPRLDNFGGGDCCD